MDSTQLTSYTPRVEISVCGKAWLLERFKDLEELWESMVQSGADFEDERIPYWTEIWPSSIVLCKWLQTCKNIIRGKRCIDLGCGLGLSSIVGNWLGAHVMGIDYEQQALNFANINASLNNVAQPLWVVMDWRNPAITPRSADILWGGDIMYEKRFAEPLLDFFEHTLTDGGRVWIAEPGRTVYNTFRNLLDERGWNGCRVFSDKISALYAQSAPVTIHIWELTRR